MSQFTVKCRPDSLWGLEGFKSSSSDGTLQLSWFSLFLSFFLGPSVLPDRTGQEGLLT